MQTRNLLLLLLMGSLWAPSFMFIKIVIQELSPLLLVTSRIVIAAIVLNVFLLIKGERLSDSLTFWKHVTIAGFFAQALPFYLFSWGEQFIDSGLTAIINGLTPICTVLLANFFIQEERMTLQKLLGVMVGFLGLLVLTLPSMFQGFSSTTEGIVAASIAATSYGVGIVYARKNLRCQKAVHAPAGQMLSASIYLILISAFLENPLDIMEISWKAIGAIFILGVFGTALAFVLYFIVLERTSASFLSLVNYLMPVFGIVLGSMFLNEKITFEMLAGMSLIFIGIGIVNMNALKLNLNWAKSSK